MKNKLCACFIGLALLAGVHQSRGQASIISSTNATPAGMALIPAGTFTKGDTWDGPTDAIPTNIYVSDFYRDTNLVSYSQPTAAPPPATAATSLAFGVSGGFWESWWNSERQPNERTAFHHNRRPGEAQG